MMVAADLGEMAYYAKHGRASASETFPVEIREAAAQGKVPVYRVTVRLAGEGEVTCELPMTTPVWAPATYRPLMQAFETKLQLVGAVAGDDAKTGNLLNQLQEPRAEVLARLDREVSAQLATEFTSAERHEAAALLLGSFTLRDTDGLFFQIRAELCRMTAHLAFAAGLRNGRAPTITGQLAEATLTVLYNNQATALKLLEAVPDDGDAGVWKRALRMRATGDFRIIGESRTHTLWEELEWFRARAESVGVDRAWESLRLSDEERLLADWTRVASARSATVGIGHEILRRGLPAEFREVGLVYEAEEGKELPAAGLVEALNAEPQRCVTAGTGGESRIRVIGWGTWAAFLQRQLCQMLAANFLFMQDAWGVPDEAAKYREEIDREFWGLRLYPFVRRQCATDEAYYKKAQDDEMAVVRRTPHVVPASAWDYISFEVPFGPMYWPPPHPFINEWHRPNPPPGTAYNPWPRMAHRSMSEAPDFVARLEQMHRLAPYDGNISYNLLRVRDGDKQTAAQFEEVYAAGLDYQRVPLQRLGEMAETPEQREKWIRKAAALDPLAYKQLAEFYLAQGREDEAAEAYVLWINNEVDDVAVANSAEWLIRYFERHGQAESASGLADRAAATYSSGGLLAKAGLLERRNESTAALELYQQQAERYDDYGPLLGFLMRLKNRGSPDHGELREKLLKQFLPSGLIGFDKAVQGAPKLGVRVQVENQLIEDAGLRRGDVIVALRGYRVADWASFKVLRSLEADGTFVLTVWRDGRYIELPPLRVGYRFGVDLADYRVK